MDSKTRKWAETFCDFVELGFTLAQAASLADLEAELEP